MSAGTYIGIDPGSSSGGIATLAGKAEEIHLLKLKEATEADIRDFLEGLYPLDGPAFALIERVAAMAPSHRGRRQGISGAFKFGASYGSLRMLLICLRIPFEAIGASVWQAKMQCRSGGDKKITKARCQELFPGVKVTHAIADALLLAELARRMKA